MVRPTYDYLVNFLRRENKAVLLKEGKYLSKMDEASGGILPILLQIRYNGDVRSVSVQASPIAEVRCCALGECKKRKKLWNL